MDLFIIAGEASGDAQGAKVIEELLRQRPGLKIGAVAGPRMRAFPIECFFPMENLQVMGFIDVFFALPKIVRQFRAIPKKNHRAAAESRPFHRLSGIQFAAAKIAEKTRIRGKADPFRMSERLGLGQKKDPDDGKKPGSAFDAVSF